MRKWIHLSILATLVLFCPRGLNASAAQWQAGAAELKITPEQPMWMSGYASRTKPAESTLSNLWAKALVLDDGQGHRAVLVTLDLVGISRQLSLDVRRQIAEKHKLDPASIVLCASHTHSGPVVGNNLTSMWNLDATQQKLVDDYAVELPNKLGALADEAFSRLAPATLEWGIGSATFAVNRRNNKEPEVPNLMDNHVLKGPVDHDLPVLAVKNMEGRLLAIAFGYACHATTLSGYVWCGDWPGFAQFGLETAHPGTIALFWAGCGGDQNPLPRRTVQLAENYGRQAAAGVEAMISHPMKPVAGTLSTASREIDLPFSDLPSRQQLESDLTAKNVYVGRRAKLLLKTLDRDGHLPSTYPYPIEAWRLGDGPLWVFLGGEPVVDFALRLKQELGPATTWVAGYSNDVMAYIPSRRVLLEGGYEGGGAMVYYGLPAPWAPVVEDLIVSNVAQLSAASKP